MRLAPTTSHTTLRDIAAPLYEAIDWSRCVIAGSYALQQFTQDRWLPGDIDILCQADSHEDFQDILNRFRDKMDHITRSNNEPYQEYQATRLEKLLFLTPEMRREAVQKNGGDERFHESIIATSKLYAKNIPLPVQLVGIDTTSHLLGKISLLEHLHYIADVPANINYTRVAGLQGGFHRLFHVPEETMEAIRTRTIPAGSICSTRRAKYEKRGYSFVE